MRTRVDRAPVNFAFLIAPNACGQNTDIIRLQKKNIWHLKNPTTRWAIIYIYTKLCVRSVLSTGLFTERVTNELRGSGQAGKRATRPNP